VGGINAAFGQSRNGLNANRRQLTPIGFRRKIWTRAQREEVEFEGRGMKVYILYFVKRIDEDLDHIWRIGVYSSRKNALKALQRAVARPGFAVTSQGFTDDPEGFSENSEGFGISEYEVGKDHWVEGYATV
jgi:hypothetical protein